MLKYSFNPLMNKQMTEASSLQVTKVAPLPEQLSIPPPLMTRPPLKIHDLMTNEDMSEQVTAS